MSALSVRELLCRTFELYRSRFKLFVAVSILGPSATFVYRLFHPFTLSAIVPMVADTALAITIILAGSLVSAAAAVTAVAALSRGQKISVAQAYRELSCRMGTVGGILISVFVRTWVGGALSIALGMIALALAAALGYNSRVEAGAIGYACGGIALLGAFLASAGIYVRYSVAVQACVVEDLGRRLALKRSSLLTHGHQVHIATVYFAFLVLSVAASTVLAAPTLLLPGHTITFRISNAAVALLAGALTAPLGTIPLSLFYLDELARSEAPRQQETRIGGVPHLP